MAKSAKTQGKKERDTPQLYTPAEYNEIVAAADLRKLTLIESRLLVTPEFYSVYSDDDSELGLVIVHETEQLEYQSSDGFGFGVFKWTVKPKVIIGGKEQRRSDLFIIKAKYFTAFSLGKGRNVDAAKAFIERTGSFAAYPYFRTLASDYSAAASLDMPVLPLKKNPTIDQLVRKRPKK